MSRTRIAVLGNSDSWYGKDLKRAAGDHRLDFLNFADLRGSIQASDLAIESRSCEQANDHPIRIAGKAAQYDAVLVRTMPLGSLEQVIFRMNALHSLAASGVAVINTARCLEIAIDKWLTLEIARRVGLEVPRTFCCQTRRDALEAFQSLGGDCVVKPIFGGEGRGIIRVDSEDLAWRVFGTLERLQAILYLQEFLPHYGYDLRVLVLKDDLFAVRRCNPTDWRTNVSQGGKAIPHDLTSQQSDMARRIVDAIQGVFIGVDILPTRDGRNILLEVNAVPGWKGTAAALDVDIACQLLNVIQRRR